MAPPTKHNSFFIITEIINYKSIRNRRTIDQQLKHMFWYNQIGPLGLLAKSEQKLINLNLLFFSVKRFNNGIFIMALSFFTETYYLPARPNWQRFILG